VKSTSSQEVSSFIMRIRDHRIFNLVQGQGLKALALKGSIWTTAGFGTQKVLQLGSNLFLTRLLFPEAFGIMALVSVFIVGLAMFSELGIKPAIIQNERGEDTGFLNTAWTLQVVRGLAIWIIASVIAWPLAQIYGQPILFPLLSFVSISAAIQGFQSTALATRNRKLQLGLLTLVPILAQVISIVIMVLLAWMYESIWALAVGSVVGALANTILSHLILPSHRHRFYIEKEALEALLNFGKWILLGTIVGYFGGQGLRAIQGLLVTPADLGIIYIASMIAWTTGQLTQKLATVVGLPVLSQVAREEPQRLRFILAKIRSRLFAMALPLFIIISLFSGFIIDTLYDQRYSAAGDYLAILSLTGATAILTMGYAHALLSVGDSRTHFIFTVAHTIFRAGGLVAGFQIGNIEGMLVGIGVGSIFSYLFLAFLAYKSGWLSPLLDIVAFAIIFIAAILTYYWNFVAVG
jgi:O-antigen/teichoic acid export membrane protein